MLKLPFFLGGLCVVCRKNSYKKDLVPGRARLAFTAISLGALRPNQENPWQTFGTNTDCCRPAGVVNDSPHKKKK
jgi:hypothetical protein